MHPFSSLTIGIFVAGYITARWDLVTRLYELAIFAWDHGVVVCRPPRSKLRKTDQIADARREGFRPHFTNLRPHRNTSRPSRSTGSGTREFGDCLEWAKADLEQHPRLAAHGISAREQLRRRGSF